MAALHALYRQPYSEPLHYRNLKQSALRRLMGILTRQPPPDANPIKLEFYSYFLNIGISALPRGLLRSWTDPEQRKARKKHDTDILIRVKSTGVHCQHHERLRTDLTSSVLDFVKECVNSASHLYADRFFAPLAVTRSLWLPPIEYAAISPGQPALPKWQYQANRCQACILARLGDAPEVLAALLATVTAKVNPRVVSKDIELIEVWCSQLGKGWEAEELIEEARELAKVLRGGRDGRRTATSYALQAGLNSPWSSGESKTEQELSDPSSIIDQDELLPEGISGDLRALSINDSRLGAAKLSAEEPFLGKRFHVAPLVPRKRVKNSPRPQDVDRPSRGHSGAIHRTADLSRMCTSYGPRKTSRNQRYGPRTRSPKSDNEELLRSAFSFSDDGRPWMPRWHPRRSLKWQRILGWHMRSRSYWGLGKWQGILGIR